MDETNNNTVPALGEKAWYIVTTYSKNEQKAADNLRRRIETMGMQKYILRILVAEHDVPIIDKATGQPTGETKKENYYPGYFFVEMIMTDDSWYIVRNTPGVTGIVGSSGGGQKPCPVPREQIEPVLKRMEMIEESMYDRYGVGDTVKVIRGPFEGTQGTILAIDRATGACHIETVFFGKKTPFDVEFSEIEKI
ncbi:MAG: transcription termination/antitermination protein NusG [Candidatus Enteromonas sp.]|nr:transcription termination/antitermination protein NusG [Candidatus Enteromonas sp.]